MNWFYSKDGEPIGPHDTEYIRKIYISNEIDSATLMWQEGMAEWTRLDQLSIFADIRNSTPPPLPKESRENSENKGAPKRFAKTNEYSDQNVNDEYNVKSKEIIIHYQGGPWSRYFARMFDISVFSFVFAILFLNLSYWIMSSKDYEVLMNASEYTFGILVVPGGFLINSVVITIFGNSPGKLFFGLRAVPVNSSTKFGFQGNLIREIRVWFYGMALALPILSIVTMFLNYREVSLGRPARYDVGFANMKAEPIGKIRRAMGMIVTGVLLLGLIAQNVVENQKAAETSRPKEWTNPATGVSTTIPGGWVYQEAENKNKRLFQFDYSNGLKGTIIGFETVGRNIGLSEYADAVKEANSEAVLIHDERKHIVISGVQLLRMDGQFKSEKWHVTYIMFKKEEKFWRIIIIDTTGQVKEDIESDSMFVALFRSI